MVNTMLNSQIKAPICETFFSIQGEGFSLGKPAIFVRFFGCNLRCRFKGTNCDTPYAVLNIKGPNEQLYGKSKLYTSMTVDDLYHEVKKYKCDRIIFTGGEPLLYQEFIFEFITNLPVGQYRCEVETNGTIPIELYLSHLIDVFNVSPKLKSSNQEKNYDKKRINYEALKSFPNSWSNYKFVVSNTEDLKEIKNILKNAPLSRVYLMPEGCTREDIISNSPKVVALCIKHGYRFSPREHIIIWGVCRGK